jgi:hypothetical protein
MAMIVKHRALQKKTFALSILDIVNAISGIFPET